MRSCAHPVVTSARRLSFVAALGLVACAGAEDAQQAASNGEPPAATADGDAGSATLHARRMTPTLASGLPISSSTASMCAAASGSDCTTDGGTGDNSSSTDGGLPIEGDPTDPLVQVLPAQIDLSKDDPNTSAEADSHWDQFDARAPLVGEVVPDFSLTNLSGDMVALSQVLQKGPVLILGGSVSCPRFRHEVLPALKRLEQMLDSASPKPGTTLQILLVYTREAHPAIDPSPYTSGKQWTTQENVNDSILVRQARTTAARGALARAFSDRLEFAPEHIVVDSTSDEIWAQLGSVPAPLYLLDAAGRLVMKESWGFHTPTSDADSSPLAYTQVRNLLAQ